MARLIELPGGEGPVNEGERRVVEALVKELPDGYWVLPNVEVAEPGGQRFEYDAIVVAPHAVYVVETKDWRGEILGDEREWLVNGETRRAPLLTTERKAKVLKSKLVARVQTLGRLWVQPVVALASEPTLLELTDEAGRFVFQLAELAPFIADPGRIGRRPNEAADLVRHAVRALTRQVGRRSGPPVFGQYEVVEQLEQSGDEAVYRARHRQLPSAPPVRLRVVSPSPYAQSEQQRAERRAALARELEALLTMGSHPNVIAAREFFEDAGRRLVLVLDEVPGRSLRQRLNDGTPMTVRERLGVLAEVCRALAHAHGHGVIHRQVGPASILLGDDGVARLARFGLAKLLQGAAQTVWYDDTAAEVDPQYLAPELANPGLGQPSPATDLYALGCVAYELFDGRPPFDGPNGAFAGPPPLPDGLPAELAELLPSLLAGDPAARPGDAKDVVAVIERAHPVDTQRPTGPKLEYEAGDVIDGKFDVRQKLGGGGFSSVYRVYRALEDCEYALKIFNTSAPYDKVKREIEMLRSISHPHVVKAVWADCTRAGQWYLVTELLEGETLEAYASGQKRLSAEEAVGLTCQLLAALEAIHPDVGRISELESHNAAGELTEEEFAVWQELKGRGIVHRDIKPQNLMLTERGLVLIDFNIASRVGEQVQTLSGTPRYQSPDLTAGIEAWDVSPDLFAAGLVLFELLCREHPYENGQPRVDRMPSDPRDFRPELAPELADLLLKACAPFRGDRFESARDMRAALEAIDPPVVARPLAWAAELSPTLVALIEQAPPNVNPMVRELLALSSQARRTNRGTRGMDDLARATYVQTTLDKELAESVLGGRHRLVIVTGNAGDGKTAFIQQIESTARQRNAVPVKQTLNGSRLRYAGREIVTLYDGSQDEADRSSDEVLRSFLAPFAADGGDDGSVRIAAINEGRLRDFLMVHRAAYPALADDVIETLDVPASARVGDGVVVVNLNLRSVTVGREASIFSRQLRAIVAGPFWGPCERCDYRTRCPLKHNVDTFRDATSGPAATERLRMLVNLVRLRRRRHLTMRDVRSLISHLLFRDRTCEEVPAMLASDDPFETLDVAYFQGPGALGVPPGSELERGAALLAEVDVAKVANPEDDRALARGGGPRRMTFPERTSDYPTELIRSARQRAGSGYESDPKLARRANEAARRQLYFERADDGWWSMLPYQRLHDFEAALDSNNTEKRHGLRREVVRAISMAEGMADAEQAGSALWLATNDEAPMDYRCFRRFPLERFELRVARIEAPYVESEPDRLALVHLPSETTLDLDVDLLEVLERLAEGYVPSAEEGRGFLVNLALFKHRLLAEPARELLLAGEEELLRIAVGSAPGSIVLSGERT